MIAEAAQSVYFDKMFVAETILLAFIIFLSLGSLLNLSTHPHWFVRGWDFPRVQIIVLAVAACAGVLVIRMLGERSLTDDVPLAAVVLTGLIAIWHGYRIAPYTPIAPVQAKRVPRRYLDDAEKTRDSIRVCVTNVQMENEQYERWRTAISKADPDVFVVLEANERWLDFCQSFDDEFPHHVLVPQENYYGMLMYSKLPIVDQEVRFLVQSDIPSIDAKVRLRSGRVVRVIGVHPRPPEPIRDTDSTARDAELILWGRQLRDADTPVIIGGDLNDVAWSRTTRLFLKSGRLLDPRRGRGFFSTFHAGHSWFRFPLDHVFHSNDFKIRQLVRLPNVGSDHFPMMIDLQYDRPDTETDATLEMDDEDRVEVEEIIDRARVEEVVDSPAIRSGEISDR